MHEYHSPLGEITLASDGEYLTGLWFEKNRFFGETLSKEITAKDDLPVFEQTDRWLDMYFSGKEPDFTPPLFVRGSDFRRRVCGIMLEIPYGHTRTYRDIAAQIASERGMTRMSAQAVGGAVGHNPISVIIPCHRVVGTNGNLTGYGGGIERKVKLLELEKTDMSGLYVPKKGNGRGSGEVSKKHFKSGSFVLY